MFALVNDHISNCYCHHSYNDVDNNILEFIPDKPYSTYLGDHCKIMVIINRLKTK